MGLKSVPSTEYYGVTEFSVLQTVDLLGTYSGPTRDLLGIRMELDSFLTEYRVIV